MKKIIAVVFCTFLPNLAFADAVNFTDKWKVLDFWTIPATDYQMNGASVDITARQSSSVIYSPLPREDWQAKRASWFWETMRSVPPTDLSQKGADDRNIALYFVFLDAKTALKIGATAGIKKLLINPRTRILVYTFGGDKPDNSFEPNPYMGARGAIIIKRSARVGAFSEVVDLAADYRQAFGTEAEALVGIALASDSDDTNRVVEARVKDLLLE